MATNANSQELGIDGLTIVPNERKIGWDHVAQKLNLPSIEESKNSIEIRLFIKAAISNDGFFEMVYLDTNVFKGQRGEFSVSYSNDFKKIKRIRIKNKEDILIEDSSAFWRELIRNNINNLPDQVEIQDKLERLVINDKGEKVVEKLMVSDGGTYDFEIKIEDNIRFISYSNPCTNAEFYTEIKELMNICQIIKVLRKN